MRPKACPQSLRNFGRPRRAHPAGGGKDLETEAGSPIDLVHAKPGPPQRRRCVQAPRKRSGSLIAGSPGRSHNPFVVIPVRVREGAAGSAHTTLAVGARALELLAQLLIVEAGGGGGGGGVGNGPPH